MTSLISIDWLSVTFNGSWRTEQLEEIKQENPVSCAKYMTLKRLPYGSRQFKYIDEISVNKKLFCTIQSEPYSTKVLNPKMLIVKLSNYYLYRTDGLSTFMEFILINKWEFHNISRLDICCDMDTFLYFPCRQFIEDYASGKYRHIGKSRGTMFFVQKTLNPITYNGLKFGLGENDCSIYLYNKTLELHEKIDKPYIRDKWKKAGLSVEVWRLEVSLKSGAMKYKEKETGNTVHITLDMLKDMGQVSRIYYTYTNTLWQFIVYRDDIKNVTREKRVKFFDMPIKLTRWVIREDVIAHTLSDKIAIKRLHTSANNYHRGNLVQDEGATRLMATEIAESTDLMEWYITKKFDWDKNEQTI